MKIMLWDLETGGVNALRSDLGFILCFGYKWLGDERTHVLTVDQFSGWFSTKGSINDQPILSAALQIMEKADLLVAHYGDRFDRRFFQGRCAIHGLMPPPPTKQRDTWAIARRAFNFSSNRLANLAAVLGVDQQKYKKETPGEWPGWWFRAMSGDVTAIHKMAEYCKQDVRTLEQIYLRLRPYDTIHPRVIDDRQQCGTCGGTINYRGFSYLGVYKYRRFQCIKCGKWDRERTHV